MSSPEGKMKVRDGVRGRVTSISNKFKTLFIKDDTTDRVYGSSDPETVNRVTRLMGSISPLFVNFTSVRLGTCALAVNVVAEEPRAPIASGVPEQTQYVERVTPPVAKNQVREVLPVMAAPTARFPQGSVFQSNAPSLPVPELTTTNIEHKPVSSWPSAPSTATPAFPATARNAQKAVNPFGKQALPSAYSNGSRQPSGFGGGFGVIQPTRAARAVGVCIPPDQVLARMRALSTLECADAAQSTAVFPESSQATSVVPSYVGRVKDPFVSAVKLRPVPAASAHRYDACYSAACDEPPLASSDREYSTPPPPQLYKGISSSVPRISTGADRNYELHALLNKWYRNPACFNKDDYPFPCGGFVVPTMGNNIVVFTRRLGQIERKEDPARKGRPYAYFMVMGPNNYQAWEYDEFQPPAFKSTKYVSSSEIEMKGYALMAPGNRDDPESSWLAWNDHTGLMRCQTNCARILKKKYCKWEPTAQMVMFDAIYDGTSWAIKTLSYIDYQFTEQQGAWPKQAYFIDDLRVLPIEKQRNPKEEIRMYSETIGDEVIAPLEQIRFLPQGHKQFETIFGAIIITQWGNRGLGRRLQCLMAAPECMWKDRNLKCYLELSQILMIREWNTEIELETPQPDNPAYHRMQEIEDGIQAQDPSHCFPGLEAQFKPQQKPHGL